jgi:acyl transferase domain-containing protein/acyl carrier protein
MDTNHTLTGLEVAVIGMAANVPGAQDIHEFWRNLAAGVESLAIDQGLGGVLEQKEYFDAPFFNLTPKEAQLLSPQVRIMAECCWHALEDAGYDPIAADPVIGVYAGASSSLAWQGMALFAPETEALGSFEATMLADGNYLCTRVAYLLNLRGPAIWVQSACSTSLVAVHLACQGLLNAECDLALAGGSTVLAADEGGYFSSEGTITSPDGHCRAFDKEAAGMVRGEGVGAVVLKRLDQAIPERDHIYAMIKGTAVNNDGNRKVGYTAPGVGGQAEAISIALQVAEVEPESVSYVEAHGTGTKLGDPVEIEALKQAFATGKKGFCGIGSVKTNIGHLDAAAGVAGLIKTVLALVHRQIPPSLHFKEPNPQIDFVSSPFYVVDRLMDWDTDVLPRRAGVSSFGIGGTNAHIVLEEWVGEPDQDESEVRPPRTRQLIPLSAQSAEALELVSQHMTHYLKENPNLPIADAAFTLSAGRRPLRHRRFLAVQTHDEAIGLLSQTGPRGPATAQAPREKPALIFVFPGLGAQYPGMGQELYQTEPMFRREMDRCFDILLQSHAIDLKTVLYPALQNSAANPLRTDVAMAQLAVFCLEYALACLLEHWGLQPDAVLGYSFGELTAACVAGAWSLEDMIGLIVKRGQLMAAIPQGAMLGVPLPVKEVKAFLPPQLSIAIDNGASCVVSGPKEAIKALQTIVKEKRLLATELPVTHAVHSTMMEPALEEIRRLAAAMPGKRPIIPMVSTVTGAWLTTEDCGKPEFWSRQLRNTVRFSDCVNLLLEEENAVFVEIGPGRDLTALLTTLAADCPQANAVNLLQPQEGSQADIHYLLNKIGHLWLWGIQPDWKAFYEGQERRRLSLPVYPFQRQYYWITPDFSKLEEARSNQTSSSVDDWFYLPSWSYAPLKANPAAPPADHGPVLLLDDGSEMCRRIRDTWIEHGNNVIAVLKGEELDLETAGGYRIDPAAPEHYKSLLVHLRSKGLSPRRVFHAWNLDDYLSLLYLAQALAAESTPMSPAIDILAKGMFDVSGMDDVKPGKAALAALARVVPQEYPQLRCRSIDVAGSDPDAVIRELACPQTDPVVALRGGRRWVEKIEPFPLAQPQTADIPIREGGVYLITGGLGEIGSTLAGFLLENYAASVVLTGRSPLNERGRRLERLQQLRGQVRYEVADVTDEERMRRVIETVEAEWGQVHGVFHLAGSVNDDMFSPLTGIDRAFSRKHLQSKVAGVTVLQNLLGHKPLDFCWLMSSISTLLGGLRFGAYAAANAAMEAMAQQMQQRGFEQWFCAAWDGMDEKNTIAAFQRILPLRGIPRVLVSNLGQLEQRYDQWVLLKGLYGDMEGARPEQVQPTQPRPPLAAPYVEPETRIQEDLAAIWQQLFGFSPIGIDDDFMELGGGSLKAITAISHIHKQLRMEIPLAEFFNRPTIRQLATFLEQADKSDYSDILPVEKQDHYPLSSAQKRLFIMQRRDLESTAYNLPTVIVLDSEPEEEAIRRIFQQMVQRHEILRTSFIILNGEPAQKIEETVEVNLQHYDLSNEPLSGDSVRRILREFVRPIDLSRAPAFHVALLTTGDRRGVVLLDMHHIITDGVSNDIVLEEFMALQQNRILPSPPLQYKDYSQWQLCTAASDGIGKQRDYWLSVYKEPAPLLNLPLDFPRPPLQTFDGDHVSLMFQPELTGQLEQLARKHGATLYMILMAVYKVLLSLYTRQEDIVVGSPITGRRDGDLQSIIGLFVNMLAIRGFPAGSKSFLEFLLEVKLAVLGAMENQEYQYYDLVAELGLQGDRSRNPLFTAVLAMQNVASGRAAPAETADWRPDQVGIEVNVAKFDLLLNVVETDKGLDLNFEYAGRLFKKSTIQAMGRHLQEVAQQICRNPHILLRDIRLDTGRETIDTGNLSGFGDDFGF